MGFIFAKEIVPVIGLVLLATIFAKWYWELNKSVVFINPITSNILHIFRYHFGNIAIHFITVLLINFANIYNISTGCFLIDYSITILIDLVSKSVLIVCVITGQGYIASLQYLFYLILRRTIRLIIIVFISGFLCFIIQIAVIALTSIILYLLSLFFTNNFEHRLMMMIFMGFVSYNVSSVVLQVYFVAVASIVLCYFEDLQRNDGKIKSPYYMTDRMLKACGKKNDYIIRQY